MRTDSTAGSARALGESAGRGPRLSQQELKRRFLHMTPGVLPLLLWVIPHPDPMTWDLKLVLTLIGVGLGWNVFRQWRQIQRSDADHQRISAVIGYAVPILATLLLFPASAEIGMLVLAILAFGDGSATLGGLYFGGPRLPWNRQKSWSGFVCFLLGGTLQAAIVYWGESNSYWGEQAGVSFSLALQIALGVALPACIAETIPSRINDNVRVGLTAAVAAVTMHTLLVGSP